MPAFLIANDSPEKILMLKHYLNVAGWTGEMLTAATCAEAYDILAGRSDLTAAFVDYYIPDDNGPAIIRRIKTKFPSCRVALVSSADDASNASESRSAGAEAVLCTSYRSDQVETAVLELLAGWIQDAEA